MHSASFNYENVAVSYQHIYGKSKHTYTFFPYHTQYRKARYQRWSGRACFCNNHHRSDNQKTEVGEASDNILNIWTHAIFLIYHIGDKLCSDESAHLYEKTNVQTNKKQDAYKVAANQILNWHIYISFTKSEISYKPNHCRHLARVFALRMYSDSHQVPLYAWHNNTSHQCQSICRLIG